MSKIHLVMPMGGNGSRFSKYGFSKPKPLIEIYGKPFFYWATMSILKFVEVVDLTFVILNEHIIQFKLDEHIKKYFPDAKLVVLDHVLNGPVLTCLEGIKNIDDDYPVLFNDCDHLFKSISFNNAVLNNSFDELDGALVTFKSNLPQYSYVIFENNNVVGTIEKKVVSSDAICGAYLFKSAAYFRDITNTYLKKCNYSEFFISGMYNVIADNGGKIGVFVTDFHIPFGIPEEYEEALSDDHYLELM